MKLLKMFSIAALLLLAASVVMAAKPATETLSGIIIDNSCATAHKADLAEFIKTHPKDCALMPNCVASGYSIFVNGSLTAFDKASNAKIVKFLKEKNSTLNVVVKVQKEGDMYKLVSIKNEPVKK